MKIWRSNNGFYGAMKANLGVTYAGADGYVNGPQELHIRLIEDAPVHAVHEFVHVVTLNVNGNFSNNPRWLWEAVALYEAGQFVDPKRLSYMTQGDYPTISELNSDFGTGGDRVYAVGYVLAEYIVEHWGLEALRELIKASGDLNSVPSLTEKEFEDGWHEWLERKYLS